MAVPLLVSCEWLHEKIVSKSTGGLVIVDVSWSSTKDCYEEYKKRHIPGAQYVNILDAQHTEIYPRNIPSAESFTEKAQKAGINPDSHVIIYSDTDKACYFISGRGWWTFRYFGHKKVSILDGGLQKWTQLGYPTTAEIPAAGKGGFVATVDKSVYKSFEEVSANVKAPKFQVVDTRASSVYSENHIPAALNLDLGKLIDQEKGTMKSKEELLSDFREAGIDLNKPIVTHCFSGLSSCSVCLVAMLLGSKDVSVFHGGFTEWQKRTKN